MNLMLWFKNQNPLEIYSELLIITLPIHYKTAVLTTHCIVYVSRLDP